MRPAATALRIQHTSRVLAFGAILCCQFVLATARNLSEEEIIKTLSPPDRDLSA